MDEKKIQARCQHLETTIGDLHTLVAGIEERSKKLGQQLKHSKADMQNGRKKLDVLRETDPLDQKTESTS